MYKYSFGTAEWFNVSDNKKPNTEHAQIEPSKRDTIYKKYWQKEEGLLKIILLSWKTLYYTNEAG
jgi:hypothetical protein